MKAAPGGRPSALRVNHLSQSGRPDSNRRRPAWEAGILPLNYARGARKMPPPALGGKEAKWQGEFTLPPCLLASVSHLGPIPPPHDRRAGPGQIDGMLVALLERRHGDLLGVQHLPGGIDKLYHQGERRGLERLPAGVLGFPADRLG